MSGKRPRWYAWWYVSIAIGFVLLAIQRTIVGESNWLVILRLVIATGFGLLAWMEFRGHLR